MKLREATPDDAPAIASLAGELGYPTDTAAMRERLSALVHSQTDQVLAAISGVAVVGWVHVCAVTLVESDPYAELRGLVVAEALRSRGFGARLLEAAEAWARSRALGRIRVRSNVLRGPTHDFYLRHGYTITKSQKVFDKTL